MLKVYFVFGRSSTNTNSTPLLELRFSPSTCAAYMHGVLARRIYARRTMRLRISYFNWLEFARIKVFPLDCAAHALVQ